MAWVISLLVKKSKIYVINRSQFMIFPSIFFNVDSSFDIKGRLLKLSVVTLDIKMQGTVSQNSYLGPSFCFM